MSNLSGDILWNFTSIREMGFDGLRPDMVRMLGGRRVKINTLSFQNDMYTFKTKDDIMTLLIHLWYYPQ